MSTKELVNAPFQDVQIELIETVVMLNSIITLATRRAGEKGPDRNEWAGMVEHLKSNVWRCDLWK